VAEALISQTTWWLDLPLALILLGVGWRLLAAADLQQAVILFITFGLILALVWVRLEAVDVALAEAAIGSGLTGALLWSALARIRGEGERGRNSALKGADHGEEPL